MSLIETREQFSDPILEGRFIRKIAQETGADIDKAQRTYMSSRGFESDNWYSGRGFVSSTNGLEIDHLKKHRWADMKTRNTNKGKVRKKQHPIHNRIIWGHYNNLVKELHFGFTHAVQEELRRMQD